MYVCVSHATKQGGKWRNHGEGWGREKSAGWCVCVCVCVCGGGGGCKGKGEWDTHLDFRDSHAVSEVRETAAVLVVPVEGEVGGLVETVRREVRAIKERLLDNLVVKGVRAKDVR